MENKNLLIGLGVLLLLAVLGGYYFFSQKGSVYQSPISTPSQQATVSGEIREIVVEGNEFSFTPESITLNKGESVRLTFKNTGKLPHNFTIDELGISSKTVSPDGEDTIDFTVDKSGTFTFYCSVGNHRAQGMEGKLEVN